MAALLVADYQQKNRSRKNIRNVERIVRQLHEAFAGPWLRITARRVERWKADQRAARIPPATINRRLAALRRMGRLAVRTGLVPSRPDFSLLDESSNVRQGFIDANQFSAFTVTLPADVADATWFAYLTCWRRANVLRLRWSWAEMRFAVDTQAITRAVFTIPGVYTRNKKPLQVVIECGRLLALIQRRYAARRPGCDYVFHRNGRRLDRFDDQWRAAAAAVGLADLKFHDLRRSAARNFRRAGTPESVVMALGGWKTRSMFLRYDITDERDLAHAAGAYDAFLDDTLSATATVLPVSAPKRHR